jgi:hypothetical protein
MANETKLSSIINPQVLADMIDTKLVDAMKFTPLCKIDNTLVGRPGDTVTLPRYAYIGDAADVSELGNINIAELTASTQAVKVKKVGKGVTISDEAVLSGYGDPIGEIGDQLVTSIASKLDNDVLSALDNASMIYPVISVTPNDVNNALVKLGRNLVVALLHGYSRKEHVLVFRLALTRKTVQQVLFSFGARVFVCGFGRLLPDKIRGGLPAPGAYKSLRQLPIVNIAADRTAIPYH